MLLAAAITATALLGDVSFLASDHLAGRATPSPGLDIAAEYIASRFRAAGLTPVLQGDGSKNVIAVIEGSHPKLRDTYVLVTAHYDHVGLKKDCTKGDCIYNGANDNASGVASMIAMAREFAAAKPRPLRSIVVAAFYGEELGFHGAKYYVEHPHVPLAKTVAMINLEQTGRTDDERGPQIARAALTGMAFSSIGRTIKTAAAAHGVSIYDPPQSAEFFARSDNAPFSEAGVPAHTVAVALMYPDYHGLDDEWDRLNYPNMARVTRAIYSGVRAIANSPNPPRWTTRSGGPPKAAPPKPDSSPAIPSPSQSPQ
jgi:Zn-dependent M28 family amino/carboxypeptidase